MLKQSKMVIYFDSQEQKDLFIGGLMDGWGENDCQLIALNRDEYGLEWCYGMDEDEDE